jgi:hypothetical protein
MSFSIIWCSVAVFWQQVLVAIEPSSSRPVVVARHHLVEHRLARPAGLRGVVVDDVHDHAQVGLLERLHHLAVLADPRRALRVRGVRALGAL